MVTRNTAGYAKVVKDQYDLLKSAVHDYYEGMDARANDVAVRIRTLIHDTDQSHSLLSQVDANYWQKDIYRKPHPGPKVVFAIMQAFSLSGDGTSKTVRDDLTQGHELVPLELWWTEEYLIIGTVRSSKRQVVLDVSNKDGGAHVALDVPRRHAMASEPPLQLGLNEKAVRPNLARGTVAQAGNELLNYLERHFPTQIG